MTIRILLADDHGVVRQGLRMYLALDPDLQVIGEAADGVEAVNLARALRPDIVLMDLLMPHMDGLAATAVIRRELPGTEVLALTSVLDDHVIQQAIRAGAIGYLLKDTRSDELCSAIRAAAAGQVQLSRSVAVRMMKDDTFASPTHALTEREMEVLRLVACGHSNREIAARLVISEKTVKAHVGNVLSKLGLTSRTQAALLAVRSGVVQPEEIQDR